MNKKPKVSICIPAYKQPERLTKALGSLLKQSFTDFEVVITDDSPDNSVENVVKEFKIQLDIKYKKNLERRGSPGNWNEGLRLATGEYIKILHHDDWLTESESLAKYVALLEKNPSADFAFSGTLNVGAQGEFRYEHRIKQDQVKNLLQDPTVLFYGNFVGAPSATIYRNKYPIEFDEKLKWLVDIDFYIRYFKHNPKFAFTTDLLITVTDDAPERVTSTSVDNPQVQVFEHVHVYQKLSRLFGYNYRRFTHLWNLFERYQVDNKETLDRYGVMPIDREMEIFVRSRKAHLLVRRVIGIIYKITSLDVWARFLVRLVAFIMIKLSFTDKKK